jgi:uncharacterized protein YndB with AHSA1/START domain
VDQTSSGTVALIVRRRFKSEALKLFEAWTSPDLLMAWWGPRGVTCPEAEVDLRIGGTYRLSNLFPDGRTIWITGEFQKIEKPTLLVYTWKHEGENPTSRVTVRFDKVLDGTEIVIVHEKLADEESRRRHQEGWIGCLEKLAALRA